MARTAVIMMSHISLAFAVITVHADAPDAFAPRRLASEWEGLKKRPHNGHTFVLGVYFEVQVRSDVQFTAVNVVQL